MLTAPAAQNEVSHLCPSSGSHRVGIRQTPQPYRGTCGPWQKTELQMPGTAGGTRVTQPPPHAWFKSQMV